MSPNDEKTLDAFFDSVGDLHKATAMLERAVVLQNSSSLLDIYEYCKKSFDVLMEQTIVLIEESKTNRRYEEILNLLAAHGLDPTQCEEYMEDCGEYEKPSPTGEWCTWRDSDKYSGNDLPCTPAQNRLLNEWKKLV